MSDFKIGDKFRYKIHPNEIYSFSGCDHDTDFTIVITEASGYYLHYKCILHGNVPFGVQSRQFFIASQRFTMLEEDEDAEIEASKPPNGWDKKNSCPVIGSIWMGNVTGHTFIVGRTEKSNYFGIKLISLNPTKYRNRDNKNPENFDPRLPDPIYIFIGYRLPDESKSVSPTPVEENKHAEEPPFNSFEKKTIKYNPIPRSKNDHYRGCRRNRKEKRIKR
jgi:hypothetical protein